ncbi:MAG: type II secretion system F family protein [Isosphaeraceae bacterium]
MTYEEFCISHARVSSKPHRATTMDDKMSFFNQLATLVAAGTPLWQALKLSAAQSESTKLRDILLDMASRIASGSSLHAAAAEYPKVFEHSWVEVIRTGEITGKMSYVLKELSARVVEQRDSQRKFIKAMTYPVILLSVATLAITAMLWFVVPTFSQMFKDLGAELPAVTQFVVSLSERVTTHGPFVAGGIVAAVVGFKQWMKTEDGRRYVTGILMMLPTIGDLFIMIMMYQFASNLSLLLSSGVPMLQTLGTMRGIFSRSPIFRDAIGRVEARVASGQPLASSLEETGMFTGMIVNMVRIGEESGQLAAVMEQIAPYYKDRCETLIAKVSKMMEPVIILGMGTAVAVMMLSIYMPMFEMSGKIK